MKTLMWNFKCAYSLFSAVPNFLGAKKDTKCASPEATDFFSINAVLYGIWFDRLAFCNILERCDCIYITIVDGSKSREKEMSGLLGCFTDQ